MSREKVTYVARLTMCTCGHQAAPWHYDSWLVCMAENCGCEKFQPAEEEKYVDIKER